MNRELSDMSVLIVDDDEANRYTLARRLTRDGFSRLGMAANGVEALAALRQDSFDLVLLDIMMPELDGFGVLRAMKAEPALAGIPVIVISANDDSNKFVQAIELGALDYLAKPFDPVLLRARVRASLERRQLQAGLETALAETRAMLELSPVATFFLKNGKLEWINAMCENLLGHRAGDLVGQGLAHLLLNETEYHDMLARAEAVLRTGGVFRGDLHVKRGDGRVILVRAAAKAVAPWRPEDGIVWTAEDVTEQRADAARVAFLAHHDQLTGLPNRILLADRLRVALAQAARNRMLCGLMFLDLDRFKLINDTLGHAIGDELLIEVSRRLKASVRDSDTVARLGGDEFVVVLPALKTVDDAETVARKILASLGAPYELSGHPVRTSPSIGIALYPTDAADGDALLKAADAAMYEAKQTGRNGYRFYRPGMQIAK
ncbi:MAG: diguanylate cyclase [Burkholderiales bacterium]|nr:diguanylate cyclase [Burkholderiales bacterium]